MTPWADSASPRGAALLIKLLNFSCSRCLFPSDHSDHFLVNINSTPGAALLPLFPWGRALNPCALTVLARERVSPVLLQNSARLHACGSNPSPSSAAISRSAASIISCRSSCLSFTSMVLLTPACWHHQRSGGGEARWPLFGDRDWSK